MAEKQPRFFEDLKAPCISERTGRTKYGMLFFGFVLVGTCAACAAFPIVQLYGWFAGAGMFAGAFLAIGLIWYAFLFATLGGPFPLPVVLFLRALEICICGMIVHFWWQACARFLGWNFHRGG